MSQEQGEYVEHIGHDECGSSDALAVYRKPDGSHDGYCWSCEQWVSDVYGDKDGKPKGKRFGGMTNIMTEAKKQERVVEIYNTMPVMELTDRAIRQDTAAYFDVRVAVDQATGTSPAEHYYPMYKEGNLVGYKIRKCNPKGFSQVLLDKEHELFGQHQASYTGSKKLIITEGECDAMAVFQVLKDLAKGTDYEHLMPAVVSITRGASKEGKATKVINELSKQQTFINKFEEVIVVFDQDEQGKASAEAVAKLWPEKVKIASLPMKDPNEMLKAGKLQELKKAVVWNADSYKPSGIRTVASLKEEARKKVTWGKDWPWPTLTKLSFGIREGELIGVGAGVGVGKTSFWHALEEQLIIRNGEKIGVFMLEEPNAKTLKRIAGKIKCKQFHNPEVTYDQVELDSALDELDDKILLYDHQEDRTWDTIKLAIRHLVLVEGCKSIVLDPITALTTDFKSSETNDELNRMFGEVSGMAEALGFTLFYSSHLNEPATGTPHEEGGRVKLSQFTGSKAMIRWTHYIIGLERDTQAEDIDEKNTVTCRVLKDREHGRTGFFPIKYDQDTGQFTEPEAYSGGGNF